MASGNYVRVEYRNAPIEKLYKRGPSFFVRDDDLARQGKNPWVKLKATQVQDAVRECREYLGTPTTQRARSNIRFREHWQAVIEWQKSDLCPKPWSVGTRQGHERIYTLFIDRPLGGLRCSEIGPDEVDRCIELARKMRKPNGKPYSDSYFDQVWKTISAAFRFGELGKFQRCLHRSQLAGVAIPGAPQGNSVAGWEILTGEECEALYSDASPRFKMMMQVAEGSGGRLSELLGLRWPEIGFDNNKITFLHQLRRDKPAELARGLAEGWPEPALKEIRRSIAPEEWLAPLKGRPDMAHSQARTVPISQRLRDDLWAYREWLMSQGLYRADGFVFPSRSHGPISQRNAARELGIQLAKRKKEGKHPVHVAGEIVREKPVGWHSFRHAYATRLFNVEGGKDRIETISCWLGHSKTDVTQKRYARILEGIGDGEADQKFLASAGL